MENFLLSPILGKRVVGVSEYGELAGQLSQKYDFSKFFKPNTVYQATLLEQEGALIKLQINDQVFYAKSQVGVELPTKFPLKFIQSQNNELKFQFMGNDKFSMPGYTVDISNQKMALGIKDFMPKITEEQLNMFFKSLPNIEGDLFENLVVFNYLSKFNFEKVAEKISDPNIQKLDTAMFKQILSELTDKLGNLKSGDLPREELLSQIKDIVRAVISMNKKVGTAAFMNTFNDIESEILKRSISTLKDKTELFDAIMTANKLSKTNEYPPDKSQIRDPKTQAPLSGQDLQSSDKIKLQKQSPSGSEDGLSASHRQLKTPLAGEKAAEAFTRIPQTIEHEQQESASIESKMKGLKNIISNDLNLDKIIDRTYKTEDSKWQNIFAWSSQEKSSFLKDITIDEKPYGKDKQKGKEYQITLDFNFKKAGTIRATLFWMDNALSCRILCYDKEGYALLNKARENLASRLRENKVNLNSLKIEQTGT